MTIPKADLPKQEGKRLPAAPAEPRGFDAKTSVEVVDRRGERERTYRNSDGTLTTQYSGAPVNYPRPGGDWAPIDPTFAPAVGGGWRNTADTVEVTVPSALTTRPARLRYADGPEVALHTSDAGAVAGQVSGSTVTYPRARPHADVVTEALPGGLSQTLVLDSAQAAGTWLLPLRLKGMTAKAVDGGAALVDDRGAERARMSFTVSDGAGAQPAGTSFRLVEQDGGPAIRVELDQKWLSDSARRFPVTAAVAVGPTTSNSNMVVTDNRRTRDTSVLKVGRNGGYSSTYLAFDQLTNPNNAGNILGHKVFGAQLWMVNYNAASCAPKPITVHPVVEAWGSGSTGAPAYVDQVGGSSFAHGYIAPLQTSSRCPTAGEGIDLGVGGRDVVQGWANGAGNFGLTVRAPDEPGAWKIFTGKGTANPPVLYVTHTPYNAEYRVDDPTPHPYVTEATSGVVKITAVNRGASAWNPADYALAYRAYRTSDNALVDQREAASIPDGVSVPVGGSITFDAKIYSEPSPAFHLPAEKYFFDFTMIRRNNAGSPGTYFTDEQIPPARVALEVFKVPPTITELYPPNGYTTELLRPTLWAKGTHLIPGQGALSYKFAIYDHLPKADDPPLLSSGEQTDQAWVIPAGALSWNRAYWWMAWAKDNQGWSPTLKDGNGNPIAPTFLTSVPQPEITSHLGAATNGGPAREFDPLVGNYVSSAVDVTVPVAGPPLTVARTYNSLDPRRGGLFGAGWSAQFDMRLTPDADGSGNVVLTYPDGQQARFGRNPDGGFAPPPGRFATLATVPAAGGGGWQLIDKQFTGYNFDPNGRLTYIADNEKRQLAFTYDVAGRLASVTNKASNRTLTFTWTGGHVGTVTTDKVGGKALIWTYSYDGDRLTKVCDPDNHCTAYDYEAGSHYRSAVVDSRPDGYWRLGEAAGASTAVSQVGVNLGKDNGTYKDIALGVPGPLGGAATAATFNGTSSRVTLADGQATKSRNLAVELWFRTSAGGPLFGSQRSPLDQDSTGAVPNLYVGTDGKLRGEFWYGQAAPLVAPDWAPNGGKVNDGQWHHVVLSGSVANQKLYLDGRLVASQDGEIAPVEVPYTQIGAAVTTGTWPAWGPNPRWFFTGDIAEVAYYTHPLGDTAVAAHHAARQQADQLNKITMPSGRVVSTMTYDTVADRLKTQVDRDGGLWQLGTPTVSGTADGPSQASNLIRSITLTDPNNRWHQYDFDAVKGRVLRYVAPVAADPAPAPPCTPAPGQICGGPVTGGGGVTTGQGVRSYDYDASGYQNTITDEIGDQVKLVYDARGNVTAKTTCRVQHTPPQPGDCQTSHTAYHLNTGNPMDPANDKPTEVRDARSAGATDTTYLPRLTYTPSGAIATSTAPDGGKTTYSYTDGSEAAYPVGDGGNMPAGLLKSITDERGKVTSYLYYRTGDLGQLTDPTGSVVQYGYDELGRKLTETQVAAALPGGKATTTFTYDAESRVATTTSPPTKNTVTGKVHTLRATTGYDADGNRTRIQTEDLSGGDAGRDATFEYDGHGRLAKSVDGEGKATHYGYDRSGNKTSTVDPNGNQTVYAYTVRNQLYEVRLRGWTGDPSGGRAEGTPNPDLVLQALTYDYAGRIVRRSDAMGRTLAYTYYADDLPHTVTAKGVLGSDGSTWSLNIPLEDNTYDAAGHLTRKVNAGGVTTAYTVDAVGRVTTATVDPGGLARQSSRTYDLAGNVLRTVYTGNASNYQGATTKPETVDYTYDDAGRLLTTTVGNDGGGTNNLTTSRAYHSNGLPKSITSARGNAAGADPAAFTTTFAYDEQGRLTATIAPPVPTESGGAPATITRPSTTTGYNAFGEPAQLKDALGNVSATSYDRNGRAVRTTLPAYTPPGTTQVITPTSGTTYDDAGLITATTDGRGNTTSYTYDQLGRLIQRQDPSADGTTPGGMWRYTYTRTGEQLSATNPLGGAIQSTYDDLGRKITRTQLDRKPQSAAHTSRFTYDDAGRVLTASDPSGATTTNGYDAAGGLIKTISPANIITTYGYDKAGRQLITTDAGGRAHKTLYDLAGRPTLGIDVAPNGAELRYRFTGFDPDGNVVSDTDPLGHKTTITYDALGRRTGQVEPVADGQSVTTSFGYDAAGHPTRRTDGRGNATITTHNSLGLTESVIEPATAAHPGASDRTWTTGYSPTGEPATLTEPGGVTRHRTFDNLGRLVKETGAGAEATTVDRVRGYDLVGRLTTVDAPGGQNTFTYDDRGNLLTTDGPSGRSSFTYNADSQPLTRTDAAGTATYGYANGRLTTVADGITGGNTRIGYTLDGQPAQLSYASGHVRAFDYDDLGRVKSDTVKNNTGKAVATIGYGYDLADRLITKTTTGVGSGQNTYGYDHLGRLTSWTDPAGAVNAYGWDASSNRVSAAGKPAVYDERNRLQSDGDNTYTFTARGTQASRTRNGGQAVGLTFDAFGRMATQGGASYAYDGLDRLVTLGTQRFSYSGTDNTPAGDGSSTYSRGPDGSLIALQQGNDKRLTLSDRHGDLIGGLNPADGAGGPADSAGFSPFGKPTATTGAKRDIGFQGGWTDPDTAHVNMAARWYDPAAGRFTSRDDIPGPDGPRSPGLNRYGYAAGDPLNHTDPSGHFPLCLAAGPAAPEACAIVYSAEAIAAGLAVLGSSLGVEIAFGEGEASFKKGIVFPYFPPKSTTPWVNPPANPAGPNPPWPPGPPGPSGGPGNPACGAKCVSTPQCLPGLPCALQKPKCDVICQLQKAHDAAEKANKRDAEKRWRKPWESLLEEFFANPEDRISCGAACPASLLGAFGQAIADGTSVWESFLNLAVDADTPVIEQVSELADAMSDLRPGGTDEDNRRRCTSNWQDYGEKENGRSTYGEACVVSTNPKTRPSKLGVEPAGFETNKGMARCHLIGHNLNGSNTDERNFVPCYQDLTNNKWMWHRAEKPISQQVDKGNSVYMIVRPIYLDDGPMPAGIAVAAVAENGWTCSTYIPNLTKPQASATNFSFAGC